MRRRHRTFWRYAPIAAIGLGLAAAYRLGVTDLLSIDALYGRRVALKAFVAGNLAVSVLGFFSAYALAVAFVFPAPVILTIAAGFLFGWCLGGIIAVLAATLGGTLLFLAARTAFRDLLRPSADGVLQRFAEGFRRDAFAYLLVLRLTPVVPVAALNIAPAFLGVRLRAFVGATLLGMMPGGFVYAFLGSGLDRALKIAGRSDHVGVADLLTRDMIVALAGLTALALLGLVLKRRLAATGPATAAP